MLITHRGSFGERDPWQTEGGGVTEDVLRALRIAYQWLDEPKSVAHRIGEAQTLAHASNKPVALLLCRDLMWEP
jgi:sulfopyruvate decarboxylase subunit alpha